jgi:uncharacterized protein with HEPN domain
MSRDPAYVLDMLRAATLVRKFLAGVSQDRFNDDVQVQSAVLYQMSVLAEAARRVSPQFKAAHPEIDWLGLNGFRNRVLHEYDHVNLDLVWPIVTVDVPCLVDQLTPLAPAPPDGQDS